MNDYLLFLDTETSGLPKNWNLPYSLKNNWPYCVQVAWLIYSKDGKLVKEENHYIRDEAVKIAKSAIKIHGITSRFLEQHGKDRKLVMQLLHDDIEVYQPLIVGHFLEFDLNMVGADLYRSGINNLLKKEMSYCTMLASTYMVKNPISKFLRLGELYEELFNKELEYQHNALIDAQATAKCFFELLRRGEVDDQKIALQQQQKRPPGPTNNSPGPGCAAVAIVLFSLIILISLFL